MGDPNPDLEGLVRDELFREPTPASARLANEIRHRHGSAVSAVLFYGSCLRHGTSEGVLDFYVLVDEYRPAYRSRVLAWANALLPPNVFYLEIDTDLGKLRSKYAVISARDFQRGASARGLRSSIWARFCQPCLAVWTRDDSARDELATWLSEAVVTAVARTLPLLPLSQGSYRFTPRDLWLRLLQETYSWELRTESPEAIRSVHEADPERYERASRGALERLQGDGRLRLTERDGVFEATPLAGGGLQPQRRWSPRRLLAKLVYLVQLLKSIATFGDWLSYVLWKLERHSGTRIVPSERQRRHPLLLGWPLLLQVLWRRELR